MTIALFWVVGIGVLAYAELRTDALRPRIEKECEQFREDYRLLDMALVGDELDSGLFACFLPQQSPDFIGPVTLLQAHNDETLLQMRAAGVWQYGSIAVIPPFVLFAFGISGIWIVRGFARGKMR
jgi:hypothetical protein